MDDWVEVMPDVMQSLSGRVKMYTLWIIVTAIGSIVFYAVTKDAPEVPEPAAQAP